MSSITLNIVIPEYYGDYEEAMRRLVEICQYETHIFNLFFDRVFTLERITAFAMTISKLQPPDVAFSLYYRGVEVDVVKEIAKDLFLVLRHLEQFYRCNPFVQRLIDQASYLDKKISVKEIFPQGLTIEIN